MSTIGHLLFDSKFGLPFETYQTYIESLTDENNNNNVIENLRNSLMISISGYIREKNIPSLNYENEKIVSIALKMMLNDASEKKTLRSFEVCE